MVSLNSLNSGDVHKVGWVMTYYLKSLDREDVHSLIFIGVFTSLKCRDMRTSYWMKSSPVT